MNLEAQILMVEFAWRYQCLLLSCSKSKTVTYFLKIAYVKRITPKIYLSATFQKKKKQTKQSYKNYYKTYVANHECVYFISVNIIYHVTRSELILQELYTTYIQHCILYNTKWVYPLTQKSPVFLQTKFRTICFLWIHYKFLSDTKDKLAIAIKGQDTMKEG